MKTISNLAGVAVGLFLMGVVLMAQSNYQKSFGGIETPSASEALGMPAVHQTVPYTIALR